MTGIPLHCIRVAVAIVALATLLDGSRAELVNKSAISAEPSLPYCVADTGLQYIFSDRGQLVRVPSSGDPFFGQDGQYQIHPPSYLLSDDGLTVHDNNTGLTWQCSPDLDNNSVLDRRDKLNWTQMQTRPAALNAAKFGGYTDWRLPTIKELYSLIDFNGTDPSGSSSSGTSRLKPFINTKYFKFAYGRADQNERVIDSQYASSTLYVGKNQWGGSKLFGVNFADGRIKGYDLEMPGGARKTFFVICVRGNPRYGVNDFADNKDGTITDRATGLMWAAKDSGEDKDWREALAWVQARNKKNYLGHNDWRLPSAKELQSIADYSRSPDSSHSAAIDPLFTCTRIENEGGITDYPWYWSATTHGTSSGRAAIYVAFGRATGFMGGQWTDVHGAGSQRSDPKSGNPANFPFGRGPQGDAIRIYNYVRLVRNVDPALVKTVQPNLTPLPLSKFPQPAEGQGMEEPGGLPPQPFGLSFKSSPLGTLVIVPPTAVRTVINRAGSRFLRRLQSRQVRTGTPTNYYLCLPFPVESVDLGAEAVS